MSVGARTWVAPTPAEIAMNHERARLVEERKRVKSHTEAQRRALHELQHASRKLEHAKREAILTGGAMGRGMGALSLQANAGLALPHYSSAHNALDLASARARQQQAALVDHRIHDHQNRMALAQQMEREQALRRARQHAEVQQHAQAEMMRRQAKMEAVEHDQRRHHQLQAAATALAARNAEIQRREQLERQEQVATAARRQAAEQAKRAEAARVEAQLRRQSAELDKREHRLRMTQLESKAQELAARERQYQVEEERRAHMFSSSGPSGSAGGPAGGLRPPPGPLGHRRHVSDSRIPSFHMDPPSDFGGAPFDTRPRRDSSHAAPMSSLDGELARERQARMAMAQELEGARLRASRAEDALRRLTPQHTPVHSPFASPHGSPHSRPPSHHFGNGAYPRSAPPVILDEFGAYGGENEIPLFGSPAMTASSMSVPTPQWPAGDPYLPTSNSGYGYAAKGYPAPTSRSHSRHPSSLDRDEALFMA